MKLNALFLAAVILLGGCSGTSAAPEASSGASSEVVSAQDASSSQAESSSEALSEAAPAQDVSSSQTESSLEAVSEAVPAQDASSSQAESSSEETAAAPVSNTVWTYPIQEGTEFENEIVVIEAEQEGPTVFIVGGQHGSEIAGWAAANLMKENTTLTRGKLYILSPANVWGAKNRRRYVTADGGDLNRAFPGDPNGEPVERIADAIWNEVLKIQPDFIFDLHEGSVKADGSTSKWSAVGNSIIYNEEDGDLGDILFDFMIANEAGEVCSAPFTLLTPSEPGGLVYAATTLLDIPAVTVETYCGSDSQMAVRLRDHIDIVNFVLRHYGMID